MALTERQRSNVAKIFINIGTITFATGVIGGVFKTPFMVMEVLVGVVMSLLCFLVAILIER